MENASVETISETAVSKSNLESSDKQKKRSGKKKRKSRKQENELTNNDSHITIQNGKADEAAPSEEENEGETQKSISGDQFQLSNSCLSTLPAESSQRDSVSCEEPGPTLHHTDPVLLPEASMNGSSKKRSRRKEKKKEDASCEVKMLDDAEKTTNEDQVHPPKNPLSSNIIQEGSRKHTQDSCEKPGAAPLCTGPNLSSLEDSRPDATKMTSSQKRKRKKKRDSNALKDSGVDIHSTDADVTAKYNTISEAEGSKSMSLEEKTVASVVINSCLKAKDNTVEQQEGTGVKLNETVSQTQSPKAKKKKKKRAKPMEVCDPLGNTSAASIQSRPVECMENNDGNAGQELLSNLVGKRENSATGEESGFQNLGKTKEKERDENTEVNVDVLGAGLCDVRSKKQKGKKKKTSSADHKTADMEFWDPSGSTLLATIESGSVECLLDHSNREDVKNCDGNAGKEFLGEDSTSKTEKSADHKTADMEVWHPSGSTILATVESGSVECLLDHSNREVKNCDGNAGKEFLGKDSTSKTEKSADHKTADMEVCDPSGNTLLATVESGSVECLLDHSNREDVDMCTVEQRESTGVKLNETVSQTQSPRAKKRKKKRAKTMEVCDPSGNTSAASIQSRPVECMENNDGNAGQELLSNLVGKRENSATGEESGFQNLGKTKEKESDENTEVNVDVLGAGLCDVRSKKRKGKKKKTSSADHKTADMEVWYPSGSTLLATVESGSVECLLDHSNREDVKNCDGNAGKEFLGGDSTSKTEKSADHQTADMDVWDPSGSTILATVESGSVECLLDHSNRKDVENCDGNAGKEFLGKDSASKTEKSATREKSGVQNPGKRKERTEDENVESKQDALGAEGVSDVGRKRQKKERNKKKNCKSVDNMDSESVQCLLSHSNREGVENCDGNADGEIASKNLTNKNEGSATEGKSVQNVENTEEKKEDKKGEVDQDAMGAEGVSKVEVKTEKWKKKSKKKKNSLDHKTDVKTDNIEEKKDDVSVHRIEEEPDIDREKLETSMSSFVLKQNNAALVVASPETGDLPRCSCEGQSTKKLVVFDLNGILADIVQGHTGQFVPDGKISYRSVFRRPFVASFLDFCFQRFVVGIWSSRRIGLDYMINVVMRNYARNLLFSFDQNICITTKFKTLEDSRKPVFLKDLRRVWNRFGTCFTCGKRKYDEANTLLVDDSPHKALCNPPHTGIFPSPYQFTDLEDSALGAEGDLRKYMERLADAENVQKFVEENPFGQTAITETHESWEFYSKVVEAYQ